MNYAISRFRIWAPRILSIAFILFLMLFSLDVFEPGLSAQQIAIGLFMHNIPALVLLSVVIVSWKYEIVGAVVFILAAVVYIVFSVLNGRVDSGALMSFIVIAGPAVLIGVLFGLSWRGRKIGTK